MIIDSDVKLDYSDVLLVPRQSTIQSRADVDLLVKMRLYPEGFVPIIAANMDHVGTIEIARELSKLKILTCLVKHYTIERLINFWCNEPEVAKYCIYSLGSKQDDYDKLSYFIIMLRMRGFDLPHMYCIDVANGYSFQLPEFVKQVRQLIGPASYLMVGNVVTEGAVQDLGYSGADIVKIGIGPGSMCTTRLETGVGFPQFSAVAECSEVARARDVLICADGGITCPGDAAKAFGAGADFVMIGGEFAAHKEGYEYSDYMTIDGEVTLPFYGSASATAKRLHNTEADYRSSEGVNVRMKSRGSIKDTATRYLNGLRSACALVGVPTLNTLSIRAMFVKVNNQMDRRYK